MHAEKEQYERMNEELEAKINEARLRLTNREFDLKHVEA